MVDEDLFPSINGSNFDQLSQLTANALRGIPAVAISHGPPLNPVRPSDPQANGRSSARTLAASDPQLDNCIDNLFGNQLARVDSRCLAKSIV